MPHSSTWDAAYEASPADTDLANTLGTIIRSLKRDIRERAEVDHDWDDTTNAGQHKKVSLQEQGADPSIVANIGYLYTKDVAGVTELFWMDSSGTIKRITTSGQLNVAGSLTSLADNILLNNTVKLQGKDTGAAAEDLIGMSAADIVEVGDPGHELNINVATAAGLTLKIAAGAATKIWHAGNDGAGSALDADLINGVTFANIMALSGANFYVSAETAIAGSQISIAHGFGTTPRAVEIRLKCTTAEHNFSIGDEIPLPGSPGMYAGGFNTNTAVVWLNATNIAVSRSGSFIVADKGAGAGAAVTLTDGSWRLMFRAWK